MNCVFSYNDDEKSCLLAYVDFLENPDLNQKEKEIYIEVETAASIKLYCRGGEHCCTNNSCDEGEGDCNDNIECKGSLVCGNNNCERSGGMWDPEDDCCERKCNDKHPCKEGGGHCEYDSDCENPGWLICGNDRCLDQIYFPRNIYINNSETFLISSDNCCHRRCNKAYYLCGQNEVGCLKDDDCYDGYYCYQDTAQPYCTDINECSYRNGKFEGLLYCGRHTTCSNTAGSFYCSCLTGFYDFAEHDGCIDINECTEGSHNCDSNADCWNTIGSFVCSCRAGYTGNLNSPCNDINECSNSEWNYCGLHTSCSNTVGSFSCSCLTGFKDFVENEGCSDINECTEGGHNCVSTADCSNTIGSFVCTCKVGYTGPSNTCYDLDECSNPDWNNCSSALSIDTELFAGNARKGYNVGPYDIGDGSLYKFRFNYRGLNNMQLLAGETDAFYKFIFKFHLRIMHCSSGECTTIYYEGSMPTAYRIQRMKFKSYWFSFQLQGDKMKIRFGINEKSSFFTGYLDTKYNNKVFQVSRLELSTLQYAIIRSLKLDAPTQSCYNTIGSYICKSTDDEMVAIGFGGHTTSGSTYPNEFTVVTKDKFACSNHGIANLGGRYAPGIAALDGILYVCGGSYYGSLNPLSDCQKLNLNAYTPTWSTAPALPRKRNHFYMVRHLSSIYAVGGYDFWSGGSDCISSFHEYNQISNVWTAKADMPIKNHRHCAVADEEGGKIYMIGGNTCHVGERNEVYEYTVSTNVWVQHSTLLWGQTTIDPACNIIVKPNGDKWLLLVRGHKSEAVHYYDLTNNVGWTHVANLYGNYNQYFMQIVSLDKYTALMLGSHSQRHGTSLKNFFEFNHETNRFEDGYYYLQNEMLLGAWTTVKRSGYYSALQNCVSERKYAAVGWGGHTSSGSDYPHYWSIMLKDRLTTGDPHKPATCHRKIPNLSPGKVQPGVTAVDYLLLVCGGKQYGGSHESTCHQLDTNSDSPSWTTMASMPSINAYFEFLTFSDAAFAIGGHNGVGDISRVDRWTITNGWQAVAGYPIATHRHCSVADEGNNRIYSMGGSGRRGNSYYYQVSTNSWHGMPGLYWGAQDMACTIIRRRSNGHKILILTGNWEIRSQWIDLTNYETNAASASWQPWVDQISHTQFSTSVSLSEYESYLVRKTAIKMYFFTRLENKRWGTIKI